ncbi:MAG: asparagine synthase (glutamine-hydrolyzing) [Gammaproteobacteria bacterium]
MCGFVGFTISAARSSEVRPFEVNRDERLLRSMLALLSHRGPDQEGVHVSSSVALGHRRLSVMAPSGGQQPRVDSRLGCALVYNGEWYDHARLRRSSATTNYRDACDTETLFQALQHDAPERVLPTLRGMFAFAYWDARTHTLTLARDRFGEKPLYYAYVQGELIFASEVKALRLHPALHRVTLDWSALLLYVMMEYIPGADTGFVEIKELPPGHTLTFNVKKKTAPTITAYWSVDNRIAGDGFVREGLVEGNAAPVLETSALETSANYTQQLESQLITTVGAQLEADRALGVFLSGGVDSSLITAVCKRHRDVVQTFTVQFPFRSFDESVYAEQVARALHTQHHTITLSQQTCLVGLETLIEKTDTPFADIFVCKV